MSSILPITAAAIARSLTNKVFGARKGHGGAPISYMQTSRESLVAIIEAGIEADRGINNREVHDQMRAALRLTRGAEGGDDVEIILREAAAALEKSNSYLSVRLTDIANTQSAAIAKVETKIEPVTS